MNAATTAGSFDGPATVSIRTGCGSLDVTTAPGNGWTLDARNTAGRAPIVSPSSRSLAIESAGHDGEHLFDAGRDAWHLVLPTSEIERLSLIAFAADARVDLPDARVDRLVLTVNASQVVVDAATAAITELSGVVNVGSLSLRLPADERPDRVSPGRRRHCPDLCAARARAAGPRHGHRRGARGPGDPPDELDLQNPDYASATHRAELTVTAHFGAIEIDPIGGCS